jgi:adenine-specific DNA methylase
MLDCKKLIEVAMPIKEISAESVRDKSIRHGHISTLHLWWARRPLPVCRAVVFASLVPDPLDKNCPQSFKDAVEIILGAKNNLGDPYKPYNDIPYTASVDKMDDNLRNRLMMFIGKFSDKYIINEKQGLSTDAKYLLSDESLIKWDNKNNNEIIGKARKLIWVAQNADSGKDGVTLLNQYETYYNAIKDAEKELYDTLDRHNRNDGIILKEKRLERAIFAYHEKMPTVFDPFAGGGAIPLESSRLGCKSFGNDINPVAHIIQKVSVEFAQKYGKPIKYSKSEFVNLYGEVEFDSVPNENKIVKDGRTVGVYIDNRLVFDVEYFAKKLLSETEKEVGHLYPTDENGNKPIAYYWIRVGTCSNPSCRAKVPLLKQFYLANTTTKKVFLSPVIHDKEISFQIKNGTCNIDGWNDKGNLICPICKNITDADTIRKQFISGEISEKLVAVIEEKKNGKHYRLPNNTENQVISQNVITINRFSETLPQAFTGGSVIAWGLTKWSELFSNRQFYFLDTIHQKLTQIKESINFDDDYKNAIISYLAVFLDRLLPVNTAFGRWAIGRETVTPPFSKQAIPFVFDYPESNPFCNSTGSALNQLEWITRYIGSESHTEFPSICNHASSGEKNQFKEKSLTAVITDPPYYDAIAYADLSDFFYCWLKKSLGDTFPLNFAIPQTPKSDECTALRHHHNNSKDLAKKHFENKLLEIFDAIEFQTRDIVSIMFAHQTTEAWTTLCNSILGARMNITGSWSIDTEMVNRTLALASAALTSSVTVSCKPVKRTGIGEYRIIKESIQTTVSEEISSLYSLGFRGADLLTACFGKAVSVFGEYERVEKSDGSTISVAELLELAKETAFNALLKGFNGDDFTKFYIGWLQLNGFTESDFDDAAKFSRVGLNINVSELFAHNLFIRNGTKQLLAGYKDRLSINHKIGEGTHSFIIDNVHKAMSIYEGANRIVLLEYIAKVAASPDNSFWRVITSLCEILPQGSNDYKQASGLLLNKDSLIRESKNIQQSVGEQGQLF